MSVEATPPTAPVEAPATPAVEAAPPPKDPFAEKIELLSKKERSIYRERQRVEQERQQLAQERAEYEKFKALRSEAKQRPLDYLKEAGLSYDDLTQHLLNGGTTEKSEVEQLREQFEALRKERDSEKQELTKQQQMARAQAETQAIDEFKTEIGQFIEQNKATYELSSLRDATEDIFTTINDAYVIRLNEWSRSGRVGRPPGPMAIKEAADIVEDFYEKEVLRLTESQKLKAKLMPQPEGQPKQASKTLTNNMASTAASVVPAKTDNDRMQRALAKLS
jgi:DNA repair exonuclease SbcCD ATPase subunit